MNLAFSIHFKSKEKERMTNLETDSFVYQFAEFERFIYRGFITKCSHQIKNDIEELFGTEPKAYRTEMLRLIIQFKMQKETSFQYYVNNSNQQLKYEGLYASIWKLALLQYNEDYMSYLDEVYFHALEEGWKKEQEDGKMTEGKYLTLVNCLKREREHDEGVISMCSCSVIASFGNAEIKLQNDTIKDVLVFRVICLPCGWNMKAKVVRFVRK